MATFTVRRGKRYRATIVLGVLEQIAGNDIIAAKLTEAGFEDVNVSGDGRTRLAEARWPRDDASAPLPSQVVEVAEIEEA